MSSTEIQKAAQRGPVLPSEGEQDLLKRKIIEHFNQLTLDPDFQKASATYNKVQEQQEQIQIRDEKIAELQQSLKLVEGDKVVALTQLSGVNQTLTTQKDNAEKENVSLQRDATEREKSMKEMSRRMQILQKQIQTELSERDDEKRELELLIEQHNREIDSFQSELKKRYELIDRMKTTNIHLESLIAAERMKSNGLEEEKNTLDQKMRKACDRLEKFDAFIFEYCETDEQTIIDGFSSLWDFATHEIWAVLRQNLSDENLGNERLWKNFQLNVDNAIQDKALQGPLVPLLTSNSDAAKGMRLAVMLGVLARKIDKEIFQPSYFPSETGHFRMTFNKIAEEDIEREQFYRSVLLSIDRDGQEAELQSRATAVVQAVSQFLHELLSNAQYVELKEKIKNVVDRAIEIWRPIQHATKRYETDFDPVDWAHDQDHPFQFPIGDQDRIEAQHSDGHLFVVSPGLSSLESDTTILTSVIPLMSSQKLFVDAKREVRGQSSPTAKQSNRKRQNSVVQAQAQSNGTHFLGGYSGGSCS